jgi:hypothetical protein
MAASRRERKRLPATEDKVACGAVVVDVEAIAAGWGIPADDLIEHHRDGRNSSTMLEKKLRSSFQLELADSSNDGYDLRDPKDGRMFELRSLTPSGLQFAPSSMIGSGRRFDRQRFLRKLERIAGYIVCDISEFPRIPIVFVSSETVRSWFLDGLLNGDTRITHAKARTLLLS